MENTTSAATDNKRANPSLDCNVTNEGCASIFNPSLHNDTNNNKSDLLQMHPLQSKFITVTMKVNEDAPAKKRRRTVSSGAMVHRSLQAFDRGLSDTANEHGSHCCCSDDDDSWEFDILRELGARTDVIQIVASSGGLISHWNDAFAKITKPSLSLKSNPLTIFELIDSKSLPSLFSMLALSLHNVGIVEVEDFPPVGSSSDQEEEIGKEDNLSSDDEVELWRTEVSENEKLSSPLSPSHLSITLPCKLFQNSSTRYSITVVFMNDIASMKRCFLGILTPNAEDCNTHGVDDNSLLTSSCDGSCRPPMKASCRVPNVKDTAQHCGSGMAGTWQELPRGKILRVDDNLLYRMLLSSAFPY